MQAPAPSSVGPPQMLNAENGLTWAKGQGERVEAARSISPA